MASSTEYKSLPRPSDELSHDISSPNSTSTSNAQFTPEQDSDDSDIETDGTNIKMRTRSKDSEKASSQSHYDEPDEEGYHERMHRRASVSTVQSYQLYTPDEERAVVRKFDKKLVFFVCILYMCSFLDRSSTFFLSLYK